MLDMLQIVTWEVLGFLFALFVVVALQILTGHINMHGLLMKKEGDRSFSPERVQVLIATLAAGFGYLSQVLKDPTRFPHIPASWLVLFAGSHAVYLGRRFQLRRSAKAKTS